MKVVLGLLVSIVSIISYYNWAFGRLDKFADNPSKLAFWNPKSGGIGAAILGLTAGVVTNTLIYLTL